MRKLSFEPLEERRVLTGEWTNPDNNFDVNENQWIGPSDALVIINRLEEFGSGAPQGTRMPGDPYYDVSGDGFVSPIDVLLVINRLMNPQSFVFVGLTNDTALGGGTATDRVTIDPSITGRVQNAKTRDALFAGWDISSDADLKDISASRNGVDFSLTESAITDLIGSPLAPGEHELTLVLRRDTDELYRLSFHFTIDVFFG